MPDSAGKFGILVGVDGSAASDAAVRWAAAEAAMHNTSLTLVHVIEPAVISTRDRRLQSRIDRCQRHHARHLLDDARGIVREVFDGADAPDLPTELSFPTPSTHSPTHPRTLRWWLSEATELGAIRRRLLGSVSAGVLQHAHCPVAAVHSENGTSTTYDGDAPVLVGIDGSPASESATALGFQEASRRRVGLNALHAWSDVGVFPILGMDWRQYRDDGQEVLAERLAGWQEQYPDVAVRRRLVCDRPAHWLIKESRHASSLWSAATAAVGSPGCSWARSALRRHSRRVCR